MSIALEDLGRHRVAIWGTGREGQAALKLIRSRWPELPLIVADDNPDAVPPVGLARGRDIWAAGPQAREAALDTASVIVKSPGISLYSPSALKLRAQGAEITSLLNLWASQPRSGRTVAVTGSKGKSTTSSLIAHMLIGLGHSVELIGNIGVAPGQAPEREREADFCVIEVSSYQAALFDGRFDLVTLTNLEQEHLDWHGSVERYYADKLNLLSHASCVVAPCGARALLLSHMPACIDRSTLLGGAVRHWIWSNDDNGIHPSVSRIMDGHKTIGDLNNPFLARAHNLANLSTALCAMQHFSLNLRQALKICDTYQGLPHRQQVLGERNGVLFVDDSISTTPQAAIAALRVWRDRPACLILGGHDRGVDYAPLITYLIENPAVIVVGMGPSGARIVQSLTQQDYAAKICCAQNMREAVAACLEHMRHGGMILLSPAAPSYGLFKDFAERGREFAKCCGFESRED